MTAGRKQLITAIHSAKSRQGISDDVYRDKLRERFGAASSTDLSDAQLRELLTDLNGSKHYRPKSKKPFVRKVFALWAEMCRQGKALLPNAHSSAADHQSLMLALPDAKLGKSSRHRL